MSKPTVYTGIDNLAGYFGVSQSTIRQWVREQRITPACYIKMGVTYRFHLNAVEDALRHFDERKLLPVSERDAIARKVLAELDVSSYVEVVKEEPKKRDPEVEALFEKLDAPIPAQPEYSDEDDI